VGGLPEKMHFELGEPVRHIIQGRGETSRSTARFAEGDCVSSAFPGPGLAVRILGEVTPERLRILRDADRIVVSEMKASDWYYRVWQSFAVLLRFDRLE
jgi:GMP synthase (glutamine-hydrolysing)